MSKPSIGHTPTPWFVSGVRFRMNGGDWHSINRYDEALKRDENVACVGYDSRTGIGLPDAHFIVEAVNNHELLKQKLEFAEFEWNRATEGMKERDATIAALKEQAAWWEEQCSQSVAENEALMARIRVLEEAISAAHAAFEAIPIGYPLQQNGRTIDHTLLNAAKRLCEISGEGK